MRVAGARDHLDLELEPRQCLHDAHGDALRIASAERHEHAPGLRRAVRRSEVPELAPQQRVARAEQQPRSRSTFAVVRRAEVLVEEDVGVVALEMRVVVEHEHAGAGLP